MKRPLYSLILFAVGIIVSFATPTSASVAIDHGNLIADHNFDNVSSMSAAAIDQWLNTTYGSTSCISTSHGFSSSEPIGYSPSGGYAYGSPVSAGTVIYDSGYAFGINPQVLLTTLEKEQSLVSGSAGCGVNRYAKATGYGCPDGGGSYAYAYTNGYDAGTLLSPLFYTNGSPVTATDGTVCTNSASKSGFSEQVIHTAWLLEWSKQRAEGNISWNIQLPNFPNQGNVWDNSDDPQTCYSGPMTVGSFKRCASYAQPTYFDGNISIDSTNTYISNGATAALYNYTPHFSGNNNFVTIYTKWFGSPADYFAENQANVSAFTDSSRAQPVSTNTINANQRVWIVMTFRNNGSTTWSNSGRNPVRLATQDTQRNPFQDPTWLSNNRVNALDQTSVGPGGIGTFSFWYTAPIVSNISDYATHFNLVAESLASITGDQPIIYTRVFPPYYAGNNTSISFYTDSTKTTPVSSTTIRAGSALWAVMSVRNNGSAIWTNSGNTPVRLATNDAQNPFCATTDSPGWLNCTRPANMDQASVGLGETATFSFWYRAQQTTQPADYISHFRVLSETMAPANGSDLTVSTSIQPQTWAVNNPTVMNYTTQSAQTPNSGLTDQMHAGDRVWVKMTFRNNGSAIWLNSGPNALRLSLANAAMSPFQDASWISNFRVAPMNEASVGPGGAASFNFWYVAPAVAHASAFVTRFAVISENLTTLAGDQPLIYTYVTP